MIFFNQDEFIKKYIVERDESFFQNDLIKFQAKLEEKIAGKKVLVIGGAGTIGSSYIKQILKYHPASLTVVDYNENGLTELTRDLRSSSVLKMPADYITYPFDFGGKIFKKLLSKNKFDIVACFAAHKHVRSEKDHLAIESMIRNNVFNTKEILEALAQDPPEHFFSVSTDKAANPVNVMGASKKLMEDVLMAYSSKMKICTARFANVAFSNGSLLAGFIERIFKRQPLSAPTDVKRYFVSPDESGELCLLASVLGESGDIFFPKLNESQMKTFSAIGEEFLNALGLKPDYCNSEKEAKDKMANWDLKTGMYPVYFSSSNTSGEKMYEEFFVENDTLDLASFKSLGIVKTKNNFELSHIDKVLAEIEELFEKETIDKKSIIELLSKHLPNFDHIEKGISLDAKM